MVQQKILSYVTNGITKKCGSSITAGKSEVNIFRGLVFHDVILSDSQGTPIVKAERIEASVRLIPLLRKKVEIDALRFIGADIIVTRLSPDKPLNIEPFINSFKSNKKQVLPWHINFKSILLRKCHLSYDVLSELPSATSCFDANHISLNDLSSLIRLKISPKNKYYFDIEKLSFSEKSGLSVEKLKLEASLNNKSLKINDIYIESKKSLVRIPSIEASFDNLKGFKLSSVTLSPSVVKALLFPSDFACFNSSLSNFTKAVEINLSFSGKVDDLSSKLRINMENLILLDGRADIKGLPVIGNMKITGQVDLLKVQPEGIVFISGIISKRKVETPLLNALGTINYMGKISTSDKNIVMKGDFQTASGNVETNISLSQSDSSSLEYKGDIQTNTFNLERLFSEKSSLGKIAFKLSVEGRQMPDSKYDGNVDGLITQLDYAGYQYKNLTINGRYSNDGFEGQAILDDENAKLDFSGLVNMSDKSPVFNFDLIADKVDLRALKIIESNSPSILSFSIHTNFKGMPLDDMAGTLTADNFSFYNNGSHLQVNNFQASILNGVDEKSIKIKSDVFSGEAFGQFCFKDLKEEMKSLVSKYIPSLINKPTLPFSTSKNNFDFHFKIEPNHDLARVFEIPLTLNETVNFDGFYHGNTGKFRIKSTIPDIVYGKTDLKNMNLLFENPQNEAKFIAHTQAGNKGKYLDIDNDIRIMNNQSSFRFFWSNSGSNTHSGTISSSIQFARDNLGNRKIYADLLPTNIILNDTIWQIHPAKLSLENGRLKVEQFQIAHRDEFIKINGFASLNNNDTLNISFNSFKLDDIFRILPNSTFLLGGRITGTATCPHLLKNGTINASLSIADFSINNCIIGDLSAGSYWSNSKKAIILNADVYEKPRSNAKNNYGSSTERRHIANGFGSYYPSGDSIDLVVDGNKVPLSFISVYMKNILGDVEGRGSGRVIIKGPLSNTGIYTRAYVENASFGIDMLNTRYYFSDSIYLSPKVAGFNNIKIKDKEGNIAYANGIIKHNHFKNFEIDIKVKTDKILAMDIPVKSDSYFSGKAYGKGTVSIIGPQNNIIIDVGMSTLDKTNAVISFLDNSEIEEFNFINFVNPRSFREDPSETDSKKKKSVIQKENEASNFTINLRIDATPDAELVLITDPTTGDEIKANGSGAIRAVINKENKIELFGKYTIDKGSYKFIYQNILRRDFNIVPDGTIDFYGDPFAAQLNISANYTVDAQLTDLMSIDELSSLNLNRSNIPVNCVLNLTGELQRPGIKLGLDFPSADDELRRRIMNVINTDEILNQQIVFLLLFGRFSSPTTNYSSGQSGVSSVLNTTISTLASQFNKMLNNVLGYRNMSFDFDYKNAAYELGTPGEWKVGMQGQWLDNRLTFEGNLGSRENITQDGTSQFIGEFDANLRMKNFEKLSWKIFNRANDNRYFKSALNTQGFGVVYKENYNNLSDLFKQMVETIKKPFIKQTPAQ
jgi:hypothetical protein